MPTIYSRYSPVPVTISQSYEKSTSRDQNGDLKQISFPNQWGSQTTSFSCSGWMSLAAESGIFLNTPGYVDASGVRVNSIFAQKYYRINSNGQIAALYPGTSGALLYKQTDDSIGTIPTFVFNTGINKLTYPNSTINRPFYVSKGTDPTKTTYEISQYSQLELVPQMTFSSEGGSFTTPAEVRITGANFFTSNITIGSGGDGYKNTILTHQGAGLPAAWMQADYLKADGAIWHRYPKRAIRIESDRIIFYGAKPSWALVGSTTDYDDFDLAALEKEIGSSDTIAVISAETLQTEYVKAAVTITFPAQDSDPNTSFVSPFDTITITEPADPTTGTPAQQFTGYALKICPNSTLVSQTETFTKGYAFSVKKGAYLTMQLGPDATGPWSCDNNGNSPYTFKPSTLNSISIRPNTHTAFNMLAENIDFLIYGKTTTPSDNYIPSIFGLNENNVPSGLIPGFMVDANIPNAVSGSVASGVFYTKYLDRAKTIPTGYYIDETPKVCINTKNAYSISSIASGLGYLRNYANLTVSGTIFSNNVLAEEIYLTPKPNIDGTGKYVANALLTVNSAGQIISRQPKTNPVVPKSPINLDVLISGNNEFTLKWDSPDNGGSEIVNYIIEFSANSGNTWTELPIEQILRGKNNQNSCTVIGLQISITYIFRVRAQNGIGIGEPSSNSSPVMSDITLSQCPKNLSKERIFNDTTSYITLSWSAPDSQGSSAISGYLIEESDNYGGTWTYYNDFNTLINTHSETIYGLNKELNYLYRISAINTQGQSTYNFIYSTGNIIEEVIDQTQTDDVLSNWDFGSILFTGVCQQ